MNANAIATVSDVLVTEFEALAARAEKISELLESLRDARQEFETLLHDSLAEYDALAASSLDTASAGIREAGEAVVAHKHQLQELAAQAIATGGEVCGHAESELSEETSAGSTLAGEAAGSAETAIAAVTLAVDQVLSDLVGGASSIDSKWTEVFSAVSTFHIQARQQAESFQAGIRERGLEFDHGAAEFASMLQSDVIEPTESLAASFESSLADFSLQLLDTGFDQIGTTLDAAIREQIAALIDRAMEEIREFVAQKAREVIERRDRSQPEREALDQVLETLKDLAGELQERIESVTDIQSAVGF